MTAGWCDWRAIIAAATVTALHHLLLNFTIPFAMFPEGADFLRVVLHAVVVISEVGALAHAIVTIMDKVSGLTDAIGTAVDKQMTATTDISKNVHAAANQMSEADRVDGREQRGGRSPERPARRLRRTSGHFLPRPQIDERIDRPQPQTSRSRPGSLPTPITCRQAGHVPCLGFK